MRGLCLGAAAVLGSAFLIGLPAVERGPYAQESTETLKVELGPAWQVGLSIQRGRLSIPVTFTSRGDTNFTIVRIDGRSDFFRPDPAAAIDPILLSSSIQRRRTYIGTKIQVEQAVEFGSRQRSDAVVVRYTVTNDDNRAHDIGIGTCIDTRVGNNDGSPFVVPKEGMVTTCADFRGPAVPPYVKAVQSDDWKNPGEMVYFTFRLEKTEVPDRVCLANLFGLRQSGNFGSDPGLDFRDIQIRDFSGDSALALFWEFKALQPGKNRTASYACSLSRFTLQAGRK